MSGNGADITAIEEFAAELGDFVVSRPTEFDGIQEFSIYCPVHEDPSTSKKPSALWNPIAKAGAFKLGVMRCFKPECKLPANAIKARTVWRKRVADGELTDSAAYKFDGTRKIDPSRWKVEGKTATHGRATAQPEVDDDSFALYRQSLMEDEEHLSWLHLNASIKQETLQLYEWGWSQSKECYIFPVYDLSGARHGMRLYDPFHLKAERGQKPRDKKRWYATEKRHVNQLWGIKQADASSKGHRRILFEGETDTMLAHQDGFTDGVTQTGGAGTWELRWNEYFRNKVVYIAYDGDDAGRIGRQKVAKQLEGVALAVYFVNFPDGQDYSEWRQAGNTIQEFERLLSIAEEVWREIDLLMPTFGTALESVNDVRDVGDPKQAIEVRTYVAGKVDTPYVLPKVVEVRCAQNKGKKCEVCPLSARDPGQPMRVDFSPDRDDVLAEIMDAEVTKTNRLISKACDFKCNDIEIEEVEKWHAEIVSIQDPVDSSNGSTLDSTYYAYHYYNSETDQIKPSNEYRMVGRRIADPRSRKLMFQVWRAERADTDLDRFVVDAGIKQQLQAFRPAFMTERSIARALRDKYIDISRNVTGIIGRRDLHMMYDLTLHSIIAFNFQGRPIDKGQLDVIVMGDTRTGKTAMVSAINSHYRGGHLVSGENASYAGLVGGSAEMPGASRRRMPDWGVLPRHNMRSVAIDEAAGLSDIVKKMSSVRTSGIAEINKQGGGRVSAKVRLFWLTNPTPAANGASRALRDWRGGAVQALSQMIGTQEDIARFDLAMATASEDVEAEEIVKKLDGTEHKKFTSDLCHNMLMFAWSRKPEHVTFAHGVEEYVGKRSIELANKYAPAPPLILGSNFHTKLARVAVALATMLYSTAEDGETVVVHRAHVDYVCTFIQRIYDDEMFGYGEVSQEFHDKRQLAEDSRDEVEKFLRGTLDIQGLPDGPDIVDALSAFNSGYFDPRQFGDKLGGQAVGQNVIQWLTRKGMIRHANNYIDISHDLSKIMRDLRKGRGK